MTEHKHKWTAAGEIEVLGEWWTAQATYPLIEVSRCDCGAWRQITMWNKTDKQTDVREPVR